MERTRTTSAVQQLPPDISLASGAMSVLPEDSAPLVSVIIPAYNIAPYIGETLDSVFAQTFANYEVIVINDGSPDTDEFERVIEPYRERIRYISQKNGGASSARNAGLRAATGQLIAFLDGDDLWSPNYLEEQLKFIDGFDCLPLTLAS